VAFRKTFYESLDQLQANLDHYLEFYNRERSHQSYRTQGRTPFRGFPGRPPETHSSRGGLR